MEHRGDIKQFAIEDQPSALTQKRSPAIHASRMLEKQFALGITDQFGGSTRDPLARASASGPHTWPIARTKKHPEAVHTLFVHRLYTVVGRTYDLAQYFNPQK